MSQFKPVLSQPDHGGRFCVRHASGQWLPLFHRDAIGRLVWTPEPNDDPNQPFNASSVLLDFKEDSPIAKDWDWTRKDLIVHIRKWLSEAPPELAKDLSRLYPRGEPKMLPLVFEVPVNASISDDEILKVIKSLDDEGVSNDLKTEVIGKLEALGVRPIPSIGRFCEAYHCPVDDFSPTSWQPVEDVDIGWMRDGRTLIKTTVTQG